MTASHHSHRRRRTRSAARLALAGGATGVIGVTAVAALIAVLRVHGHRDEPAPRQVAAGAGASHGTALSRLKTGTELDLTTPDGYTYAIAAVRAGTADRPLHDSRTPPPAGATLAYIDYVITNTGTQPALLDFPADLFVRRSALPASVAAGGRCMPQPGAPADFCTLPDHTDVVNTLGYPPPPTQEGDQYIPPGAGYLVRVATDLPVNASIRPEDMALYVWNPRFVADRRAVLVPLP